MQEPPLAEIVRGDWSWVTSLELIGGELGIRRRGGVRNSPDKKHKSTWLCWLVQTVQPPKEEKIGRFVLTPNGAGFMVEFQSFAGRARGLRNCVLCAAAREEPGGSTTRGTADRSVQQGEINRNTDNRTRHADAADYD